MRDGVLLSPATLRYVVHHDPQHPERGAIFKCGALQITVDEPNASFNVDHFVAACSNVVQKSYGRV